MNEFCYFADSLDLLVQVESQLNGEEILTWASVLFPKEPIGCNRGVLLVTDQALMSARKKASSLEVLQIEKAEWKFLTFDEGKKQIRYKKGLKRLEWVGLKEEQWPLLMETLTRSNES